MAIAIRLPDELEEELCETAKRMRRSKSFLVREAVASYLEDINDYYSAMKVLKNPGRIYSSEEARKELGLDD